MRGRVRESPRCRESDPRASLADFMADRIPLPGRSVRESPICERSCARPCERPCERPIRLSGTSDSDRSVRLLAQTDHMRKCERPCARESEFERPCAFSVRGCVRGRVRTL